MHRSSESIASLAAALAKAQITLTNPEKSLTGSVPSNRSDDPMRNHVRRQSSTCYWVS
jgi:hypothetical protein